jgi:hypothetical protein
MHVTFGLGRGERDEAVIVYTCEEGAVRGPDPADAQGVGVACGAKCGTVSGIVWW